jgi:hypothetical protein
MKFWKKLLTLLFVAVLLSSCTSYYRAYNRWNGDGYQETFYAPDIVSVSFSGNANTSYENVNDFAMLRAAELALQNNYKYFAVNSTRDLTQQHLKTSAGSSTTTEKITEKNGVEVKTTEKQYYPPSTSINEYPKVLLEIQFFNDKPENVIVYESDFVYNSIKSKYRIE